MIWKYFVRIFIGILVVIWIVGADEKIFGIEEIHEIWRFIQPGGKLHPVSFLEHKGHLVIEISLLVAIFYLVWLPRSKPKEETTQLTEKEIDELCQEWIPEPLVPEMDSVSELIHEDRIIDGRIDKHIQINGKTLLNMQSTDFLGLLTSKAIQKKCKDCIEKYGVGSCGPRSFYGSMDVHLELEKHVAQFMGVEESIVYSYDIATVPSLLPAFANAKDVIVADESVSFPIQTGCRLSRAQIYTFRHNDMEDLEQKLIAIDQKHIELKKPLNRRFIIVEGIYHDCGDVALLDKIYRLKTKYKYRLVVDESLSFGVLGKTGRGACEEFGLSPGQAEIVTASLSHSLASVGGFCVGNHDIVGHQRLNGHGYVFSASVPPYLAVAADEAITVLEHNLHHLKKLRAYAALLREELAKIKSLMLIGSCTGVHAFSPVIHLTTADELLLTEEQSRQALKKMEMWMWKEREIAICVPVYSRLEWRTPLPSLRVIVTLSHTQEDLLYVARALADAAKGCL